MKILIADDDPQILRALRITLGARGYDIVTAHDGTAALNAAIEHHPDLVMLDLGMPRLDGLAVSAESIRLTPTEWRILEVLLRNPGKLVTRESLLTDEWGPHHTNDTGYLRLYVAQLRKKLEADPSKPRYLLTEAGMGYRFNPDEPTGPDERPGESSSVV